MLLCMHTQKSDVGMKISFLCHNIFAHDIILYIEKQQTVEIKLIKKKYEKMLFKFAFQTTGRESSLFPPNIITVQRFF